MKDYEITFKSCNSVHYAKPITAWRGGNRRGADSRKGEGLSSWIRTFFSDR